MSEYIVEISKGDFGDFLAASHGRLIRCRECQHYRKFSDYGNCSNKGGLYNFTVRQYDFCSHALPRASKQEVNK